MSLPDLIDSLLRLRNAIPASSGGPMLEVGLSVDAILAGVLASCVKHGALDPPA